MKDQECIRVLEEMLMVHIHCEGACPQSQALRHALIVLKAVAPLVIVRPNGETVIETENVMAYIAKLEMRVKELEAAEKKARGK